VKQVRQFGIHRSLSRVELVEEVPLAFGLAFAFAELLRVFAFPLAFAELLRALASSLSLATSFSLTTSTASPFSTSRLLPVAFAVVLEFGRAFGAS
jgi:hypothetical protein